MSRLAPSPTGSLHLGHARTFLLTSWHVRALGGRLVLRHEDIDGTRRRPEVMGLIEEELRWLGIAWDGEPLVQSRRWSEHQRAFERLREGGQIYPCICSHQEVLRAARAPHADEEVVYAGTCRGRFADLPAALAATDRPVGWRFRVDAAVLQAEPDLVAASWHPAPGYGGDFLVGRTGREGVFVPGYQLAVVVDDALAGVNLVVRGRDLLPSTPRQRLLHAALGTVAPAHAHLGLVLDGRGQRLAKRENPSHLVALRRSGVSAEDVRAWVAVSAGIATAAAREQDPAGFTLGPEHAGDVTALREWCNS